MKIVYRLWSTYSFCAASYLYHSANFFTLNILEIIYMHWSTCSFYAEFNYYWVPYFGTYITILFLPLFNCHFDHIICLKPKNSMIFDHSFFARSLFSCFLWSWGTFYIASYFICLIVIILQCWKIKAWKGDWTG